ncbi:o-succinylbenzoate synthase [Pallidibacillus pasinlerensis]|uniref:o-succinylbenzoate synthase n=1 Tax=Pallidibacillus pasinlerensis TaxID=2703818 RepID=A0ABX0A2P5_9BACI|nr:o-succinylbenzoate synthase [Pallidibacillus pasinlerensis]NCU17636.1 o-succinylbenzoate synthase [Pallidibacillus pasinlerensis]
MGIPIKQINIRKLNMRLKHPFTTSFGTVDHKELFVIEVTDDEGNRGFCESVAFSVPWYTEETVNTVFHIIEEFLIPILRKKEITHPDDVSQAFKVFKRNHMAKAAIEGAVWDLYAKRERISLARALGGERKQIDVGISIGIQPTIKELLKVIEGAVQEGYKRIKLKIKPGQDIELLREVRRHFPDIPLMADANSAYSLEDIEHLKKLDEFNLMMIEQPLADDDILQHAELQSVLKTSICLDESIHSLEDVKMAYKLGSCKIINIKPGRVGGLSEAKRIHDFCQKHNLEVWCGGMLETGIGRAQNIALASLPQFTIPGDISSSSRYWEKDIISPEVVAKNGIIDVPEKPGIGYEVDFEKLNQFVKWERVFKL